MPTVKCNPKFFLLRKMSVHMCSALNDIRLFTLYTPYKYMISSPQVTKQKYIQLYTYFLNLLLQKLY